ncbi:TPR domain protein [Pseudooceanicola batsensis HTCC2597]|uniref:TPR domain protein n=1 Tax=Pseudooceanicola batsensis (strain ATCC BAA-863 / DSM 15984 / KCTC 12145 / HTCC2597) TaxID=252305 RepID=A3TUI6_PSEBH|nr:sulfotransferase [Pseudooceanicola batsensis]EAQ04182.1 TPR domain protein [Pseudooceanicola batsensis HTCC2597]
MTEEAGTILARAQEAFNAGRVSDCHTLIEPLIPAPPEDPRDRARLAYLQLGCALYQTGDLALARRLNAELPTQLWRPMRYRLSLRLRDPATARRLRTDPGVTEKERDDFRTTAGLHMLWARRYRTGFPLYACRHNAILFPRTVPKAMVHVPLPADPGQDEDTIILEQGLGDVLFHLAHVRHEGAHETARFVGLRKYGPLIRRYFPRATYLPYEELTETHQGLRAHLAGDFVGRGFARTGRVAAPVTFDSPRRRTGEPPVWGICWRGGSGQNRREERHIALRVFLDLLPRDARFLALQFDMTPEEREILTADARCMVPLADVAANPVETINMIRPLAGVISVDSANWHMAGLCGVPLLAIMNRTAHWFWGPDARAENAYPCATTIRKEVLDPGHIADWIDETRKAWSARPASVRPAIADIRRRPVLVTGLPRSATSMTMRVLHAHGLWLGETVPGNRENPQGYFESRVIRDGIVKPLLSDMGADPLGVRSFPPRDVLPPCPPLARRITRALRREGYDGSGPWGFKDPKLTLLWQLFDRAYPQAIWVIVRRDRGKVLDSLCRTSFMARHSTSPEYWTPFCNAYDFRLNLLRGSGARIFEVDADALSSGDLDQIRPVIDAAGLTFEAATARAALARP